MNLVVNEMKAVFMEAFLKIAPQVETLPVHIQFTKNPVLGHLQCNSAMALAGQLKRNPREIAEEIVRAVDKGSLIDSLEIAGPGFINIRLTRPYVLSYLESLKKQNPFSSKEEAGPVIIDYSAPNIAKRMHIGHLRSTIIGDSLKRIYRFLGYKVIGDNHVGDWGTQFGKLIIGYRLWLDEEAFSSNPIEELEKLYVKFERESVDDPSLLDQARIERTKLQAGDEVNVGLWQRFIDESLKEYEKVYSRLDIHFETHRGESFYRDSMPGIIGLLKEKGLARESEGALVVFFDEDENLHPAIVQTGDGGYVYSTSDLACIQRRMEEYAPSKIIYVTDDRQIPHFKQVFSMASKLGWNAPSVHVPFGIMKFTDGHFSSRKGNVIYLDHLLDEAVKRSFEIVTEKNPRLSEEERRKISSVVGIGAVKYFDLSQNRTSNIVFDWDRILSFEGNTSPYIQYVYARIQSLLGKADEMPHSLEEYDGDLSPGEDNLIHSLLRFPDSVLLAGETNRPNIIAEYIYDLCQSFNSFYNSHPILKERDSVKRFRLHLCGTTASLIRSGLDLLGIGVIDRM